MLLKSKKQPIIALKIASLNDRIAPRFIPATKVNKKYLIGD